MTRSNATPAARQADNNTNGASHDPPSATESAAEPGLNLATALGTIVGDIDNRTLPSGSDVLSFSIRIASATLRTATVPVAWHDPPARASLVPGDEVLAVGRVVRRFFRSGGATQSRTELVASRVEPTRRKATCRRMVEEVVGHLEATVVEKLL